jgi:hypothetical protein
MSIISLINPSINKLFNQVWDGRQMCNVESAKFMAYIAPD